MQNNSLDESSPSVVSEDDRLRSQYMERLVHTENNSPLQSSTSSLPRTLFQFWDNSEEIPMDVRKCMDSWRPLKARGFKYLLFDDKSAAEFIKTHFESRYLKAFKLCRHPAMRSDYFRLCFILNEGGFYIDADDVYQGININPWFEDETLKLHPLCYNPVTDSMVGTDDCASNSSDVVDRVFYVNNNPIIAPPEHPIIRLALERSTKILLAQKISDTQDVQSTTGPGNLTASLVRHSIESRRRGKTKDFSFLMDWDSVSVSQWPLDYRKDKRNWRLWDGDEA